MHAKDVVEADGDIRHVAAGAQRLDYSLYLSLRDLEVPLIAHGRLSEHQVPRSLALPRATTQRCDRKRLLGAGVG